MTALGSPAITPHLNLDAANTHAPTFTLEDAIAWASSHGAWRMPSAVPTRVVHAEFMTCVALGVLLGMGTASIGLPDDAIVCYVELEGQFTHPHPYSPNTVFKPLAKVFEVFVGRTGNFIMAGGAPN